MSNQNNNFVSKLKIMAKKDTSDSVEVVANCDQLVALVSYFLTNKRAQKE